MNKDRTFLHHNVAALYATLLPILRAEARRYGYTLAVHGSLNRDLDIVAIPWVYPAAEPIQLAKALRDVSGGYFYGAPEWDELLSEAGLMAYAGKREHGRLTFPIHFTEKGGLGPYIDLSIIPPNNK